MKLFEFQAKKLMADYGIEVPPGDVARSVEEAVGVSAKLGFWPLAIKAQVHAGGRGKVGGVKIVQEMNGLRQAVEAILGMQLVSIQTGAGGLRVEQVLIERAVAIEREFYLALLPDRAQATITVLAGAAGGMDIEQTADRETGAITTVQINPLEGINEWHCGQLAEALDLPEIVRTVFSDMVVRFYELFTAGDALLLEINPLALTVDGGLIALDAKMEIDDNALFRQQEIAAWRADAKADTLEARAAAQGLNYIKLEGGAVGSMVNGAGLAMATMDIIKQAGLAPANFLDVGGGASSEMIENGLRILLADPDVSVLFINIFGGILRCDVLARGIVQAAAAVKIGIPVVVRLAGTNAEEGREILQQAAMKFQAVTDLAAAAGKLTEFTETV